MRKLNALADGAIPLPLSDRLAIVHDEVKENIRVAYEKSVKQYNLRRRPKTYSVFDVVSVRTRPLSDVSKKYCATIHESYHA